MMSKVERLLKAIDTLEPKEKGLFIHELFAKGLIPSDLDPFALLRAHIPANVSDKQVGAILGQALRRIRHPTASKRRHR